ncbi:hypothetical protein MSG28_001489 [Choristoneura fumiferana]|uniref:Uncharacterized protein n=1 Tax=Choristoneura fumiferana TaxID=7141 RepID=A0ACC0KUS2_CHOFU|nr:hypothetical protein MSG28_001489 [Choristoneura fumiferana]
MWAWVALSAVPLWLALSWYFPFIWGPVYLFFFTVLLLLLVFVLTLWGHVALSSPQQTSLFLLDKVDKELRQLEETLKEACPYQIMLELNQPPMFALAPHLMSCETELHYLRQTSELIVMFLLPRCYSFSPASHLMREVLACKVFQPAIDLITEPDYINQKIIQYLEAQKEVDAMHVRTHEYAKTFEDYIRLINNCNNVDTLKRLRYDIVTQIMQATTLQNMKRAKGVDSLLLHKILESVTGRRYLSMFLETMCSQGLVGFWMAVEELRHSPRSSWHQLGAEIFYTYIRSPSAEIKVDKDTRKRMESFLLGDKGPEVFYEVQDTVVDTIQEKYYSSFLLSEQYKALMIELANEEANKEMNAERSPIEDRQLSNESASSGESVAVALHLTEHSTYARRKLDQLQERHNNKTQALAALRASLKPESRALAMLASEVERLAGEQMRLEAHLARTDTWAEHLGTWRATVQSAEELHRKLRPMCSELKNLELPSNSFKFLFGKNDRNTLDKAKTLIQKYLEFVLEDERLNQSEALYTFLNPTSEYMKQGDNPKKNKFSFSTLFKRSSQEREAFTHLSADEDEISLYLDGNGTDSATKNMTNSMRKHTRTIAMEQLSETIVDALSSLVGVPAATRGAHKLFLTLQNTTHNKQLFYELFELVLLEVFPELKRYH